MIFHSSYKIPSINKVITLSNNVILAVNKCSFLRVIPDSNLKYINYIAYIQR